MKYSRLLCRFVVALLFLSEAGRLLAALSMSTSTSAVSIAVATTNYNAATGAAQVIVTAPQTLTITSNSSTWTLSVRAGTATFSFTASSGDPNPNKSAADLAVRAPATSSTWLALTSSNQVLSTGPKAPGGQTRAIDYRLNSNLSTDPPGTYSIAVIYTLTSP